MTPAQFKTLRTNAGLSVAEIASQIGKNPTTVWRYENGTHRIPLLVAKHMEGLAK